MPTATIHVAFAEMHTHIPFAPFKYCAFQELIGPNFSVNWESDPPAEWSENDVLLVKSYLSQFANKRANHNRDGFASLNNKNRHPGLVLFSDFVKVLWKKGNIQSLIYGCWRDQGCHPIQILQANQCSSTDPFPYADHYVTATIDNVGTLLFGEEGLDRLGKVLPPLRNAVDILCKRVWNNLKNQSVKINKKFLSLERSANIAFQELDRENSSAEDLRSVIGIVHRWMNVAGVNGYTDHLERVQAMKARLDVLMTSLGVVLDDPVSEVGLKADQAALKCTGKMVSELSTSKDMEAAVALYSDFFSGRDSEGENPAGTQPNKSHLLAVGRGLNSEDLGITPQERNSSHEALGVALGFKKGLPLLFNYFVSVDGSTPWSDAELRRILNSDNAGLSTELLQPISLHWHQLAAVHATLRMAFSAEPSNTNPGVLIADEVGLGKTFQGVAVLATLASLNTNSRSPSETLALNGRKGHQYWAPPAIRDKPFLGNVDKIPDHANLIIVPGTLLDQWQHSLETLLNPSFWDIFVYSPSKSKRKHFWGKNGPFHLSVAGANRVILATHSALQSDFSLLYCKEERIDALPWQQIRKRGDYGDIIPDTLFGQSYNLVMLDEAHIYRNPGARHMAALKIMELALLRLPMTATPLQTSPKDVAAMGRLAGVPHFFTKDSFLEDKADAAQLRQYRKLSDQEPYNSHQLVVTKRMQATFEGRILRRTSESLDFEGTKLINIPPYEDITIIAKIRPWEMSIIKKKAEEVEDTVSASNSKLQVVKKHFYSEHRMCVIYAREDMKEKIPRYATLADWEKKTPTKLDICARICNHLLSRDDAPPIQVVDGSVLFPDPPPLAQGQCPSRTTKIIVSHEFPHLCPLICNAFDLFGIKHCSIDGKMSFAKRGRIVREFCSNPEIGVLIMSPVGSVGLNLSVASVIIFLDQPWSSQDELQIRGRAHRQPQTKIVRCYHILADETADIVLAALARGKEHMMTSFLQQKSGQNLLKLITGSGLDDAIDEESRLPQKSRVKYQIDTNRLPSADSTSELDPLVLGSSQGTGSIPGDSKTDTEKLRDLAASLRHLAKSSVEPPPSRDNRTPAPTLVELSSSSSDIDPEDTNFQFASPPEMESSLPPSSAPDYYSATPPSTGVYSMEHPVSDSSVPTHISGSSPDNYDSLLAYDSDEKPKFQTRSSVLHSTRAIKHREGLGLFSKQDGDQTTKSQNLKGTKRPIIASEDEEPPVATQPQRGKRIKKEQHGSSEPQDTKRIKAHGVVGSSEDECAPVSMSKSYKDKHGPTVPDKEDEIAVLPQQPECPKRAPRISYLQGMRLRQSPPSPSARLGDGLHPALLTESDGSVSSVGTTVYIPNEGDQDEAAERRLYDLEVRGRTLVSAGAVERRRRDVDKSRDSREGGAIASFLFREGSPPERTRGDDILTRGLSTDIVKDVETGTESGQKASSPACDPGSEPALFTSKRAISGKSNSNPVENPPVSLRRTSNRRTPISSLKDIGLASGSSFTLTPNPSTKSRNPFSLNSTRKKGPHNK